MQTAHHNLMSLMGADGRVSPAALPDLRSIVECYPYYHLARLVLLRLLYQMRDPAFHEELRRAALYLPSRETIYEFVEGEKLRPRMEASPTFYGATRARKANERISGAMPSVESRTKSLIDSFLDNLPTTQDTSVRTPAPIRRGRADATTDYIAYMLAEEEERGQEVREASIAQPTNASVMPPASGTVPTAEKRHEALVSVEVTPLESGAVPTSADIASAQDDADITLKSASSAAVAAPQEESPLPLSDDPEEAALIEAGRAAQAAAAQAAIAAAAEAARRADAQAAARNAGTIELTRRTPARRPLPPAESLPETAATSSSTAAAMSPSSAAMPPSSSASTPSSATATPPSPAATPPSPTVQCKGTNDRIDDFIQNHGDRRIRLKDKKDSELQKPVLDVDKPLQQGTFTESLARIYISQGKYEHAIEIIKRLSLKYPKKNRYFADQIRFLEKLIVNQKAAKATSKGE